MKLDAIFLVAPKPAVPSMSTRRAFLLAGATFAIGTSLGGACGYAMAAKAEPTGEETKDEELKPSGDVDLDELRWLAVKAPVEELVERRPVFTAAISFDYRKDAVLWRGIDRICSELLKNTNYPNRILSATVVAQVIELAEPAYRDPRLEMAKQLRTIR